MDTYDKFAKIQSSDVYFIILFIWYVKLGVSAKFYVMITLKAMY